MLAFASGTAPGSRLERVDAQPLAHIVVHANGKDLAVESDFLVVYIIMRCQKKKSQHPTVSIPRRTKIHNFTDTHAIL